MRNRAKCKLCDDIIESFHRHDYVECSCGEIAVDGGQDYLRAVFKNAENFLRIDDEENELPIKYAEDAIFADDTLLDEQEEKPFFSKEDKKDQVRKELKQMIANIESLPDHAKQLPINHYDFCSFLILFSLWCDLTE